jgi:hypothetical protein
MLYQLSYVRAVSILPFNFRRADAGFAGVGFPTLTARSHGGPRSGPDFERLVCDDDRRAELHVMEEPLGVRDMHADAAV